MCVSLPLPRTLCCFVPFVFAQNSWTISKLPTVSVCVKPTSSWWILGFSSHKIKYFTRCTTNLHSDKAQIILCKCPNTKCTIPPPEMPPPHLFLRLHLMVYCFILIQRLCLKYIFILHIQIVWIALFWIICCRATKEKGRQRRTGHKKSSNETKAVK